jgi:hypothetical protein
VSTVQFFFGTRPSLGLAFSGYLNCRIRSSNVLLEITTLRSKSIAFDQYKGGFEDTRNFFLEGSIFCLLGFT